MEIYKSLNSKATIKTYKDIGHKHPEEIKKEIIKFFKEVIEIN